MILSLSAAALLDHVATSTAMLALAALADLVLRRRGRHFLRSVFWSAAALKLVIWPGAFSVEAPTVALDTPAIVAGGGSVAAVLIIGIWAAGAAVCVAWVLVRAWRFRRRVLAGAKCAPPSLLSRVDELRRRIDLRKGPIVRITSAASGAVAFGLLRPTIVLPERSLREAGSLDNILLHELSHVKRNDLWIGAATALLRAVYWFHPLVGLLARRIAELREIGCDHAAALAASGGAEAYRATLLECTAERFGVRPPALVSAWTSAPASIVVRLRSLQAGPAPSLARRAAPALALAFFACAPTIALRDVAGETRAANDAAARAILANVESGGRESCFAVRFATMHLALGAQAPPR